MERETQRHSEVEVTAPQETLTPEERRFVRDAKKVIAGHLARAALIFSAVLAGAGVATEEKSIENVAADGFYEQTVIVEGHTVKIGQSAGAERVYKADEADVNRVRDAFVELVNDSTVFKDRVIQGTPADTTIYVLVSENNPHKVVGAAQDGSSTVFIDIGDIDVTGSFLKPPGANANTLASKYLKSTLAHEFNHLLGIGDPQTGENAVTIPLFDIERKSYYGYCREDGQVVIPYNVNGKLIELNDSDFWSNRRSYGYMLPAPEEVCPPGGVGGIAELPEISESPQNMPSEKSKDSTIPIAAGVVGAVGAALAATGATLYIRKNRSV